MAAPNMSGAWRILLEYGASDVGCCAKGWGLW